MSNYVYVVFEVETNLEGDYFDSGAIAVFQERKDADELALLNGDCFVEKLSFAKSERLLKGIREQRLREIAEEAKKKRVRK